MLNELEAAVAGRLDVLVGQWNGEIRKVTETQKTGNKSFSQHFEWVEVRIKVLESGAAKPLHSAPPTISQSKGESPFASAASWDPILAVEVQGVQKLLSISNPAQFTDKLVSHLLTDANVHLHEFLPHRFAPSSESTFVIEDNHLQLSVSIKWFCSPQDVLLAVQNILEVLSAVGKLCDGAVVDFAYWTQIQKLLDCGHSLDTVVGVHEEFLMHLRKHDSFDVAGDTVLGKSLFQSLCASLPFPSSFLAQRNFGGSSTCGSWGSGQWAGPAPPKDGCYICGG